MDQIQQPLAVQGNSSREERTFRDPTSIDSVEYRIRGEANHLYEDPDIDEDVVYRIIPGDLVTKRQLETCAEHFSSDYGVWSERARFVMGPWAEYGKHIRLSHERLRAQCLPNGVNNILVVVVAKDGRQFGHCFMSQWTHGDDRVWWITQLLVLRGYRNQRRATKMLQALAMHYDVGRSNRRDLVGVATSNPYTICTVLRIFGRGIEVLPSKLDWERKPVRHTPLPSSVCEPIIETAPIDYLRDAKMLPRKLTANTRFFIDHAAPDEALERILHSMNKQVLAPWEWLFGHLEPGYEYVCMLDYSFDLEYKTDAVLCDELTILNGAQSKEDASNPVKKSFRVALGSRPSEQTSSMIRYAEIDRYLLEVPGSCVLDPKPSHRAHASLYGSMRKLVFEAKELIANTLMLSTIMNAKQIPDGLRRAYQSANLYLPLPEQVRTWSDFTEYAYDIFEGDINVAARLLILQAIHFQELRDNHEKSQRERAKEDLELAKAKRAGEKSQSVNGIKQKPVNQPPVFTTKLPRSKNVILPAKPQGRPRFTPITSLREPLAPKPQGPTKTVETSAKASAFTPKPRSTSMLSSIGSSFRRLRVSNPRRSLSESKPRGSIPTTNTPKDTPAPLEQTPPQTPPKHSSEPAAQTAPTRVSIAPKNPVCTKFVGQSQHEVHAAITPPATPLPCQPRANLPHYMAPTVGSMQRYKTHSPELFYSDKSDDESRSTVSGQPSLKNSGKILDRTQGKRG